MNYITYTKEDKDETTAEAEREVEATQQRDVTKETFAACNILKQYAASLDDIFEVYNSIHILGNLIECNFQQNLKQTKLTDYFKTELNQLS